MRRAAILATAACLLLLAGCAGRVTRLPAEAAIPHVDGTPAPTAAPDGDDRYDFWNGEGALPTEEAALYGSVGLITEPTILVSVYLDEASGRSWDEEGIAESRRHLAVAVDWLREQVASYGAELPLYYDEDGSALCLRRTVDHRFNGDDEGDDFHLLLDGLCAELDTDALHEAYGAGRVGFLFFPPTEGSSYTMAHYAEDGGWYYHEYSLLYRYDVYSDPGTAESPAVYAHELLHMYGAPDLYEGSADYYVTDELADYVYETWPDAIMQYTYNDDGSIDYDRIQKSLCPLTAFRLGLCDTFAGIERFPAAAELPAGVFAEGPLDAAPGLADLGGIAV